MLEFVSDLVSLESPDEFRAAALPGLRELVPCESASYNEVDLAAEQVFALTDPDGIVRREHVEALARLGDQNPLIMRYQRTRDGRPYKWSDLVTRRELHASELYRELYAPLGIEFQMAMVLPAPEELIVGLAVNRGRRDFSERDRRVLNMVRAPLIQAYRTVQRYAKLAQRLAAAERGLERRGYGVVVLEAGDPFQAAFASEDARRMLGLDASAGPLPEALAEWLGAVSPGAPAVPLALDAADGGRAVVHLLSGRAAGDPDSLLVERAEELLTIADLRAAGLTGRQAQVLRLVALGRGNPQIAAELTLSERTVHKHLENIYDRLGVTSRTQAVLTAWSIGRGG